MQATAILDLIENPEDFEFYFPSGLEQGPQSNLMSLGFYTRASCTDAHSKFDEVLNAQISWEPVYANGEDCGLTSYVADAEIQTH
jgi:hypothetical protein